MRAVALALAAVAGGAADAPACAPSSVAQEARCGYVRAHADACWPDGWPQRYLEVHECWFSPAW